MAEPHWKTEPEGLERLAAKERLSYRADGYALHAILDDFPCSCRSPTCGTTLS